MHRLVASSSVRASPSPQNYICRSCAANKVSIQQFHSSSIRRSDRNGSENIKGPDSQASRQQNPNPSRAQRSTENAKIANELLRSARSQSSNNPISSSPSSARTPRGNVGGVLDLRAQAATSTGAALTRKPPSLRPGGYRGRGGGAAGSRQGGHRTGYGGHGELPGEREGWRAARGRRGGRSGDHDGRSFARSRIFDSDAEADADDDDGEEAEVSRHAMLSDREIEHLLRQREAYHSRQKAFVPNTALKPADFSGLESAYLGGSSSDTNSSANSNDDSKDDSNTDTTKASEKARAKDTAITLSPFAADPILSRLHTVASTRMTRFTPALGERLVEGKVVELYGDEHGNVFDYSKGSTVGGHIEGEGSHVDAVVKAARETIEERRLALAKQRGVDVGDLVEEYGLAAPEGIEGMLVGDGKEGEKKEDKIAEKRDEDIKGLGDVDFQPLGDEELDFLAGELVGGRYDEKAFGGSQAGGSGSAGGERAGRGAVPDAFREATRQMAMNGTYLPKDMVAFTKTMESILGGGGGGGGSAGGTKPQQATRMA